MLVLKKAKKNLINNFYATKYQYLQQKAITNWPRYFKSVLKIKSFQHSVEQFHFCELVFSRRVIHNYDPTYLINYLQH